MSEIFENAITSIRLGIEDFQTGDDDRMLSAARNYYAGLLLLAKQCLLTAAPKADPMNIIGAKFKPVPDGVGGVVHEVQGYTTVDLHQLKERFKVFKLKWPATNISKLQKFRNDLEHHHLKEPVSALSEAIASSFPMIIDFFEILGEEPKEYLEDVWESILEQHDAFAKVQKQCLESLLCVKWPAAVFNLEQMSCPNCSSSLIGQADSKNTSHLDIKANCFQCGFIIAEDSFAEMVVETSYSVDAYILAKEGGMDAIATCPNCSANAYVETHEISVCFNCGESVAGECSRCSAGITVHEYSYDHSELCSYCLHMYDKIMQE